MKFKDVIKDRMLKNPKVWIHDHKLDSQVRFEDLLKASENVASQISDNSLTERDIVHYVGENSVALISIFCGITFNDWIPVGSNPSAGVSEISRNIDATDSKALAISKELFSKFKKIESKSLRRIFVYQVKDTDAFELEIEKIVVNENLSNELNDKEELDDIAFMTMTSGSTGLPKAVMIDGNRLVAGYTSLRRESSSEVAFISIGCQPFCNVGGLSHLMAALFASINYIFMEGFDCKEFLNAVQRHECNYLLATPAMLNSISKYPDLDSYDFSNVYIIGTGGAKVNFESVKMIKEKTGINDEAVFGQSYGMSECFISHFCLSKITNIPQHLGKPLENIECQIIDPNELTELSANTEGEICLDSPYVMRGYYKDRKKTESVFLGRFFRTGDLGKIDEEGNLFVTGRIKDVIKFRAFSVFPAELENVLLSHDSVSSAAVMGEHHDEHGEIPVAFVCVKSAVTEEELLIYVAEHVTDYKRIHKIYFHERLPLNNGMKIDKVRLKKSLPNN